MTPWADLPEHDKLMIAAAKNRAPVLVRSRHGVHTGTLIAWTARVNRPTARVRYGTGTHCTVPGHAVTLVDAALPVVEPLGYDRRRSMA